MTQQNSASEGLGVYRKGNAVLCIAWGETDVPEVAIARSADAVRAFFIEAWFGDPEDPNLKDALAELAAHDWMIGGDLAWSFEIGGVELRDVTYRVNE